MISNMAPKLEENIAAKTVLDNVKVLEQALSQKPLDIRITLPSTPYM
jgi:hypothetical protein